MIYNDVYFSYVDEIDHLTIRFRQGKSFDLLQANKLITRYNAWFPSVKALGILPMTDEELASSDAEKEMVTRLVPIRDEILDLSGLMFQDKRS
ncbi:MAG: hypothetical protein MJ141_04980 [Clostridia bacterium]|nr:hypothetical protein [Clostridia bacterium]